jgi:hypothetical protein
VWLFSAGQAAKASERDALALAHHAGKRVLGVLNKSDQVTADETAALLRHVAASLGDSVEALLPLSARDAFTARQRKDDRLLEASGLPSVLAALEERFFANARDLKRKTALGALLRFVHDARALVGSAGGDAMGAQPGRGDAAAQLDQKEASVLGVLAAQRVAMKARLDQGFSRAAREVLEFLHPRDWLGERRIEKTDHDFLLDFLEDEIAAAVGSVEHALEAAAAGGPGLSIARAAERFTAYARGVLEGGIVDHFLEAELFAAGGIAGGRERPALERALCRHIPDPDPQLFAPLAREIRAAYAGARADLAAEAARGAMRTCIQEERIRLPLDALEAAVKAL